MDADSCALFTEQKKFMFSMFAITLRELSTALPYGTYTIEGEASYRDTQMIWCDLVALFISGQARKLLQQSVKRKSEMLHLDCHLTKLYLTFGQMVDLQMLTGQTTDPYIWCIH